MPHTWLSALESYWYPVDTTEYRGAFAGTALVSNAFDYSVVGDRESTIVFEKRFRKRAEESLPHWYEVVYWKMYSQIGRRDEDTDAVIEQMSDRVTATHLYRVARNFVEKPSRQNFNDFRKLFFFRSTSIATVATFPAFLSPERFPMVDTRIAKWAMSQSDTHNALAPHGAPCLESPTSFGCTSATVLTMADWSFYCSWISWTRAMAKHLSHRTQVTWRPQDVEMAAFTAWGDHHDRRRKLRKCDGDRPLMQLNPWP